MQREMFISKCLTLQDTFRITLATHTKHSKTALSFHIQIADNVLWHMLFIFKFPYYFHCFLQAKTGSMY